MCGFGKDKGTSYCRSRRSKSSTSVVGLETRVLSWGNLFDQKAEGGPPRNRACVQTRASEKHRVAWDDKHYSSSTMRHGRCRLLFAAHLFGKRIPQRTVNTHTSSHFPFVMLKKKKKTLKTLPVLNTTPGGNTRSVYRINSRQLTSSPSGPYIFRAKWHAATLSGWEPGTSTENATSTVLPTISPVGQTKIYCCT